MNEENKAVIKALNMYGRVPETWELLNEIERLNNIINKLEEYCWELKAMGCREGALDMLDKIEELKNGDNNE